MQVGTRSTADPGGSAGIVARVLYCRVIDVSLEGRRRMAATPNYPTLRLRQGRDYAVLAGHPWLFSGAFEQLPADLPAGSVVDVVANSGEWVARGHLNAKNSLAFRALTRDAEEPIDVDF